MRRSLSVLLLAAGLGMATTPADARNGNPAERRIFPYDAQVPRCDDQGVIGRIQQRFNDREATYYRGLRITGVDRVRQTAFRPNGRDFIPRRHCQARATTSDGRRRHLSYVLAEDAGISGWHGSIGVLRIGWPTGGYGLEWCVAGLDRHFTYAPGCVMTQP
jgi:hypothetical protein